MDRRWLVVFGGAVLAEAEVPVEPGVDCFGSLFGAAGSLAAAALGAAAESAFGWVAGAAAGACGVFGVVCAAAGGVACFEAACVVGWPLAGDCSAPSACACASWLGWKSAKNSCHAASTEEGSSRNRSYISSTSHSLGPNCDAGLLLDTARTRLYPSRSGLGDSRIYQANPPVSPRVTELAGDVVRGMFWSDCIDGCIDKVNF